MSVASPLYVAFIRNVMIGRAGLTKDVVLRAFTDAGALVPRSHLATGNVSFALGDTPLEDLVAVACASIAEVLGRAEPIFVRSVTTLQSVIGASPFVDPPIGDVRDRCVTFTDTASDLRLPLNSVRGDAFIYARRNTDFYSVTRLIDGRTGSPNHMIERALSCRASTRNWNTIERVVTSLTSTA